MSYKEELTLDFIKSKINYNPDTGVFTRLPSNNVIWFNESSNRLIKITKDSKEYRIPAHNLAWFIITGSYPDGVIMHKNMNKFDFRFKNLKVVSVKHLNRATLLYKDYINGYKAKPHETDQYKYIVQYYDGKTKQKYFEDIGVACAFCNYIKVIIKNKLIKLGVELE